nr:immunoglobulin light chain junction region [Macaca mulatta]MOY07357.1 immunoglobulin light chain junction region [Macaca mulatta]MOY09221.1 immunoglobulin light chain junction region [Macaca mulatta]
DYFCLIWHDNAWVF